MAIDAWLMGGQLDAAGRDAVASARRAAIAELQASLALLEEPALRVLGLPPAATAVRLCGELDAARGPCAAQRVAATSASHELPTPGAGMPYRHVADVRRSDGELDAQAVAGEGRAVEGPAGAVGGGLVGEGDVGDDELAAGIGRTSSMTPKRAQASRSASGEASAGRPPT